MATNYVTASFQEIYDVSTKPGSATIIGIHTPVTTRVHNYLHGYFEQYRKFKYQGCSIVAVPMATLPIDPLQVSYEAGEPGIDPRDMLNPILHRCIHGDSLGNSLESIFNIDVDKAIFDSLDKVDWDPNNTDIIKKVEQMYYSGLVSTQWKKAHVQKGFRRKGIKPMYYGVGVNRQMMPWTDEPLDTAVPTEGGHMTLGTSGQISRDDATLDEVQNYQSTAPSVNLTMMVERQQNGNYVAPQMFAGGMRRLGWLDTLQTGTRAVTLGDTTTVTTGSWWTVLPKLNMYLMMLPPSYKCRMTLRLVIKHYYSFKEFRSMRTPLAYESVDSLGNSGYYPLLEGVASTASAKDTLTLMGAEAELVSDGVI